jgi:hypothetical protein
MYKILSIDGGGIKGVFPASFLASIEESIGDKIANYFDLIVGTSTGGIIALALGLGFSAQDILTFYEELGPDIFAKSVIPNVLRSLVFSKYNNQALKASLFTKFGDRKLGESLNRLVIPSFNLETGKVHVYKTAHHIRFERDYKESVVNVALATASAPTYFPTHISSKSIPLVDGGMWANNPVGFAVVEAIGVLGWKSDYLNVLSIGCTSEPLNVGLGRKVALGKIYWGTKITDVFMTAQSSGSLGMAQLLAGHENIVRINPIVPNKRFELDGISEISYLKGLGDSEAREAIPKLRESFFDCHAEPFKPFYLLDNQSQVI